MSNKKENNVETTNYQEYFKPELDALDNQYNKNEKLYDEVHRSLERKLDTLEGKSMFGSGSPHRDVAELGKVLNDIRGNQVQTIKERTNVKKTIKDFELRERNLNTATTETEALQEVMKKVVTSIQYSNPAAILPTASEKANNSGIEKLKDLDPQTLGLNENDLKMIDRFKKANS